MNSNLTFITLARRSFLARLSFSGDGSEGWGDGGNEKNQTREKPASAGWRTGGGFRRKLI